MKHEIKKIILQKLSELGYSKISETGSKQILFTREQNDLVYIINLERTRFKGYSLTSSFVPHKYYDPKRIINFSYFTGCDVSELNDSIRENANYSSEYFLSLEFAESNENYADYVRRIVELIEEKMLMKYMSWDDILHELSENPWKMLDLLPVNIYKSFPELSEQLGIIKKGKFLELHYPKAIYDTTKYQGRPMDWPKEIIPRPQ